MSNYNLSNFLSKYYKEYDKVFNEKIEETYFALSSALVHLLEEKSEEKIYYFMFKALAIISHGLPTNHLSLNTLKIDEIDTLLININRTYSEYLETVNLNPLYVCMEYAVTLFEKIDINCLKKLLNLNQ